MHLMILLTVQNLGSAMADVVIDAMIAEAVRLERYVFILNSYLVICTMNIFIFLDGGKHDYLLG